MGQPGMSSDTDDEQNERRTSFRALRKFFAGAVSGAIAKTAVAPFDRYDSMLKDGFGSLSATPVSRQSAPSSE